MPPSSVNVSPPSATLGAGGNASFTVTADGTSPFSYSWYQNGSLLPGQNGPVLNILSAEANATAQISVGSLIYAFGTAGTLDSGNVTLDASAGRARLGQTTASGMVTVQGSGVLTLDLVSLGGRSASAFDFLGTGTSASYDASVGAYQVTTGPLDLTNDTSGSLKNGGPGWARSSAKEAARSPSGRPQNSLADRSIPATVITQGLSRECVLTSSWARVP